ncbi:Protein of unknown function [Propionibacterium cyclohexanicum]|uniref:DUF4235 domain-containing protein n=1 Tax=Propionibacterium cyclohexanicum TaxID=64702 RepID=A0A1H9QP03_9ACTN|nr:DUF4235 domain-containing protein [Propionibacterium cyclohexanicum]SER62236.1 Protein of unknown function [Propionibacterium cyclohexanicum]
MATPKNLQFKLLGAVASAGVALVGQRLLKGGWRRVTGEEPPDPSDPQVPATKAISWLILSTLLISVVQLLIQRKAARQTNPITKDRGSASAPFSV